MLAPRFAPARTSDGIASSMTCVFCSVTSPIMCSAMDGYWRT